MTTTRWLVVALLLVSLVLLVPGLFAPVLTIRGVLTRDRELLKCREIQRGCYVRALKPEAQLQEVVMRYGLAPLARPFTLCLHCNLELEPLDRGAVAHRVPEKVLLLHPAFTHCRGCDRVYWPGSHYERMRERLRDCLP